MRLDFFMLADGASAAEGKAYIHGGAITRVDPPAFPSPPLLLTAVTRLLVDPTEIGGEPHELVIEWRRAGGETWTEVVRAEVRLDAPPPRGVREGEDQGVLIVAPMLLGFEAPGSQEVRLRVDGESVCTRRLFVTALDDPARRRRVAE